MCTHNHTHTYPACFPEEAKQPTSGWPMKARWLRIWCLLPGTNLTWLALQHYDCWIWRMLLSSSISFNTEDCNRLQTSCDTSCACTGEGTWGQDGIVVNQLRRKGALPAFAGSGAVCAWEPEEHADNAHVWSLQSLHHSTCAGSIEYGTQGIRPEWKVGTRRLGIFSVLPVSIETSTRL